MTSRSGAALAVAAVLGGSALTSAPVASAAPSTVYTTGFESGTAGWYGRGGAKVAVTTEAAHSGTQSLAVTGRTQNWEGPGLDAKTIMPAGTYKVEAWVKLPSDGTDAVDTDQVIATAARTPNGGTAAYDRIAGPVTVTEAAWTLVSGTYEHGTTNSSLELYLESPTPSQSFLVDDVTITGEAATTAPATRSDIKTDFESGL